MKIRPIHFSPYLKPVIWGGNKIADLKGKDTNLNNIGESWEISSVAGHVSVVDDGPYKGKTLTELIDIFGAELVGTENFRRFGNRFPLLVKFIDAADNLSVQVHPDDRLAMKYNNSFGKTEMWVIINAEPKSKIYAGLSTEITPEEFSRRVADHTIMDVIAEYAATSGDVCFLPAGCIHAIGTGNVLVEIQQTSDITYRIYDYDRRDKDGNPRELHVDFAREAIDYAANDSCKIEPQGQLLIDCPYFVVHRISDGGILPDTRDSFTIVICLEGTAKVSYQGGEISIKHGDTYLFPASMRNLRIAPGATVLSVQA